VFAGEVESPVFVKVAVADRGAEGEYWTYAGAVGPSEGIEASVPGDPVRPGPRLWEAFAFSFWALTGAACSGYFFLVSTGPIQAGPGYGIWLSEAPPESLPGWTGLGPLGPYLFPFARLGLLSWLLALIVFPVGFARLSKAQRPQWWSAAWTYAAMTGMALAVLAIASYQLPAEVSASNPMGYAYVKVPFINWQEIPAAIGFLVLAVAMWWILTAPRRLAARPVELL
jgi:hypothetical protein